MLNKPPARRVRRAALAAVLLSPLITASVGAPASAGPACTPSWTVQQAPGTDAVATDVDVVAGDDVRFTEQRPFAGSRMLRWDGTALGESGSQVPMPPRTTTTFEVSNGSFAPGGSSGWAVVKMLGDFAPDGANLMARWDGARWALAPGPVSAKPDRGSGHVVDVASLSADQAWSVGDVQTAGALTARWDGAQWTAVDNPAADRPYATLVSVHALSATGVWAVGQQRDPDTGTVGPLVLHHDGTAWKAVTVPAPDGPDVVLRTVTATGPDDVWIAGLAGKFTDTDSYTPLLMHWDGQAWKSQPAPPKQVHGGQIERLYVAGPGDLWATVAYWGTGMVRLMHGDGTSWQEVRPQGTAPDGYEFQFNGVDGTGPNDVWAVGTTTSTVPSQLPGQNLVRNRRLIAHLSCGGK
ncbi:hypothetical protein [Actinomadura coerulea]|uniref:hypothetical protein n=1 Tax=Actinomadura coerulea TaxID=46159 RepID=UPI00343D830D